MLPTPFILADNLLQPSSAMPDRLHHLLLRKPDLASFIFRNADLSSDNMSPEELLFLRQLLQNYSRLCDGMHIPQLCQPVTPLLPIEKGSSILCGASAAGSIMQHSEDCFGQSNFGSVKPKPTVQPQLLSNHPSSENKILLQCGSIPSVNIIVGNNVTSSGLPLSVAQSCNKSAVEEVITKRYEESACTPRPRWCPTPEQIQLLEALFNSGTTTPSRDMIVQIAGRLKQYGNIAEANVFYWFQNRKARAKRKLQLPTGSDGGCVGKEGRNTRRRVSTKTRFEKKSEEVTDMTEKALCQDHNLLRHSFSMGMSIGELGRIHPAINIPEIQQNLMPSNSQTANLSAHNYWSTQLPTHSLVAHQQMQQLDCSTMDNFQTVVHTPQLSSSSSVEDTVSFSQQINLTDAALHQLSSSNVHPQQSSLDVVTSKLPSCSPVQDIAGYTQQNFVPTEFSVTRKSNKPQENIACYINSQQRFHGSPPQVCTSKVEESVLCSHQNYLLAAQYRRWLETSKGLSEKQFCDQHYHDQDPLQKIQNQACLQQKALQDTEAQMQTAVTLRPPNVASATKNTISSISVISESNGSNLVSQSQAAQDCYEVTSTPISTTPMLNSTAADSLVVSSLPEMINDYEIPLWEAFTGSYGAWESESR